MILSPADTVGLLCILGIVIALIYAERTPRNKR